MHIPGASSESYHLEGRAVDINIAGYTPDVVLRLIDLLQIYDPVEIYDNNPAIHKVLDQLIDGTIEPNHPQLFKEIYQSLLFGDYGTPDPYLVVRDFDAYKDMQATVAKEFTNKALWNKKAVINTATAGFFSSDRTITEYNKLIWNLPSID